MSAPLNNNQGFITAGVGGGLVGTTVPLVLVKFNAFPVWMLLLVMAIGLAIVGVTLVKRWKVATKRS